MKTRNIQNVKDTYAIDNITYNEQTGAKKVIIVEPVVKKAVTATDTYQEGSLIKVTGTAYTLQLLNKAFSAVKEYLAGQTVTQVGKVYESIEHVKAGPFDANQWNEVAIATIGPVTVTAGSVVSCGKWHNNVGAIGFLIDDESTIA